jgi:hypothetical protein
MVPQADQDKIQAAADAVRGKYPGDHVVPNTPGPYTYYANDDPDDPSRGRVYTVLPGKAGEYFNQQRWYLGSTAYESYELPDSKLRNDVTNYWVPSGMGPSREEIKHLPPDDLRRWARQAWINNHSSRGPADEGTNQTLDYFQEARNSLTKMRDILQTLDEHGLTANSGDLEWAKIKNAQVATGWGGANPMSEKYASALRDLDEESNRLQTLLKNPKLLLTPGAAEGLGVPDIKLPFGLDVPTPSIPGSNPIQDAAFSGRDIPLRVKNLDAIKAGLDDRYQSLIGTAQDQWQHVDPKHLTNIDTARRGQDLPDQSNQYRSHHYPTQFPIIPKKDYPAWAKAHPNTPFTTEDDRDLQTPP